MSYKIFSGVIAATLLLASCSDDFTDWLSPQHNDAEGAKTAALAVTGVDPIDLASVTTDSVKLFTPSLTAAEATTATFDVTLSTEDGSKTADKVAADGQGRVAVADLTTAVQSLYGKRPTYRTLSTLVTAYVTDNGEALRRQGTVTSSVKAVAPVIEEAYYLIGTQNNWDPATVTSYKFNHSAQDVYDDPVFTLTVKAPVDKDGNRVDFWFNIVPQSSLSITDELAFMASLLGSDKANGDDRLEAGLSAKTDGKDNAFVQYGADEAKKYKIDINLLDGTMSVTPFAFEEWIYMPGNPQGWAPATAPMLRSPKSNGVYTGYAYLNGEFKFTKGPSWDAGEYNWYSFTTYGDGFTEGGGGNINHAAAGYYLITANVEARSLTAVPVTAMGLIGDALPSGWDADADMTYVPAEDCWTATVTLTEGKEFKFRVNHDWAINLGGSLDDLTADGANIKAPSSGSYTVKLYASRSNGHKAIYATLTKASSARHARR